MADFPSVREKKASRYKKDKEGWYKVRNPRKSSLKGSPKVEEWRMKRGGRIFRIRYEQTIFGDHHYTWYILRPNGYGEQAGQGGDTLADTKRIMMERYRDGIRRGVHPKEQ